MITTHVLDTARGRPAAGIGVTLERWEGDWVPSGVGRTDADGRCRDLFAGDRVPGTWRITFAVEDYFGPEPHFYPTVEITFSVADPTQHFHVPLLLAPFGYSTYRGS